MFNSKEYWNTRYKNKGNSGTGSRGKLLKYKADYINDFIQSNNINNVFSYGCGDGHQLNAINCPNKEGFDVSEFVIVENIKRFPYIKFDTKIHFKKEIDLLLSLDVIYHLVEPDVYNNYIETITKLSPKFVIIYSWNSTSEENNTHHVKSREITKDLLEGYRLVKTDLNKYKGLSLSDWFIYERENSDNS